MSAQRRAFVEAEKQAGGNVVKACVLLGGVPIRLLPVAQAGALGPPGQ